MADTLPLAVAIAASPFPVIPSILLLFTPRPRATSLSFLAGWFMGILCAVTVFVVLAEVVETGDETPAWASWVRLSLGVALVVIGVRQWLTRHDSSDGPAWMRSLESAGPVEAVRLSLVLSFLNPKILLLAAAGGLAIGAETGGAFATLLAVLGFTAVASITVAVPVLSFAVFGERVLGPLRAAKGWLERNNATVMAVVITVIGAVLVAKGIRGL